MKAIRSNDEWVRCKKCGHKLFRIINPEYNAVVEIKCHSCKELNVVRIEKADE